MNKLQIGYARECYTPDTPQPQNSVRMGREVLTDLYVTCIAMSDGEQTALIFSNDLSEQTVNKSELSAFTTAINSVKGVSAKLKPLIKPRQTTPVRDDRKVSIMVATTPFPFSF